jgi:hypothetical protein
VSFRSIGRLFLVACVLPGLATGGLGCLSDDTSVTARTPDAGALDGSPGIVDDAGGSGDGGNGLGDAAAEASGIDGALSDAAPSDAAPSDAGREAGPLQAGLVVGGTVGHSPHYKMTLTSAPAAAPVLRSRSYQLVGGVAVTGN